MGGCVDKMDELIQIINNALITHIINPTITHIFSETLHTQNQTYTPSSMRIHISLIVFARGGQRQSSQMTNAIPRQRATIRSFLQIRRAPEP